MQAYSESISSPRCDAVGLNGDGAACQANTGSSPLCKCGQSMYTNLSLWLSVFR